MGKYSLLRRCGSAAIRWFAVFVVFLSVGVSPVSAVMVDTDLDGVTDWGEETMYHTDPALADTDLDGIGDGAELVDGTDPLDPASSKTVQLAGEESVSPIASLERESLAWYVGRTSGIVAFLLLTFVVANGLLISSRVGMKFIPPAVNLEMHRFASWLLLLAVVLHGLSFTYDRYIHLDWVELLVPFMAERDFPSALGFDLNLAIAPGVVGFYLIVLLIVTSELRKRISTRAWRFIHYSSFVGYLLVVAHGIGAGTDSVLNWTRILYGSSAIIVTALVVLRIRSAIHLKRQIAAAKANAAQASLSSSGGIIEMKDASEK